MGQIVYLMNLSLDGFVEGPDGKFEWTRPDEEVFRFHIEHARQVGAYLNGWHEYRLVICPVLVGGGKPYFPQLEHLVPLRLRETRTFQSGALYLRYQRA
jgi:hypothetical protein